MAIHRQPCGLRLGCSRFQSQTMPANCNDQRQQAGVVSQIWDAADITLPAQSLWHQLKQHSYRSDLVLQGENFDAVPGQQSVSGSHLQAPLLQQQPQPPAAPHMIVQQQTSQLLRQQTWQQLQHSN